MSELAEKKEADYEIATEGQSDNRNRQPAPKQREVGVDQFGFDLETIDVDAEAQEALSRSFNFADLELNEFNKINGRPMVYAPWHLLADRLDEAFGMGSWKQLHYEQPQWDQETDNIAWPGILVINEKVVSTAIGNESWKPSSKMDKGDAFESAKSDCLRKLCKPIMPALRELWKQSFQNEFWTWRDGNTDKKTSQPKGQPKANQKSSSNGTEKPSGNPATQEANEGGVTRYPFGEHEGKPLSETPNDSLEWYLNEYWDEEKHGTGDFAESNKAMKRAIKKELESRDTDSDTVSNGSEDNKEPQQREQKLREALYKKAGEIGATNKMVDSTWEKLEDSQQYGDIDSIAGRIAEYIEDVNEGHKELGVDEDQAFGLKELYDEEQDDIPF